MFADHDIGVLKSLLREMKDRIKGFNLDMTILVHPDQPGEAREVAFYATNGTTNSKVELFKTPSFGKAKGFIIGWEKRTLWGDKLLIKLGRQYGQYIGYWNGEAVASGSLGEVIGQATEWVVKRNRDLGLVGGVGGVIGFTTVIELEP